MNVKLLDCTLRDGGYVNNWQFGDETLLRVFKQLQHAGIDVIEVGYLRDRENYVQGRSVYPSTSMINRIFSELKQQSLVAAMIDYGDCAISSLEHKEQSIIDILRITFRKHQLNDALEYCRKVMELGYEVCLQPVSVTSYARDDMKELCERVNDLHPAMLGIVDSYGLMDEEQLLEFFDLLDNDLDADIGIGYHSHNNFQLACANAIQMIKHDRRRTIMLDASLYGMGKSAGNCNTELLGLYLNKRYGKKYDINEMLDVIERFIIGLNDTCKWGYQLRYYVSAMHQVHPNYVNYLANKGLPMRDISEIIEKVEPERALIFDEGYLEELCTKYLEQLPTALNSGQEEPLHVERENHISTIIFDIDGTILDTSTGVIDAVEYVIQKCRLKKLSTEDLQSFVAYSPLRAAFIHYCGVNEVDADVCCSLYREYYKRNAKYKSRVYDHIKDILQLLKQDGYKLGVATYKDEQNAKDLLQWFQLDQYFDCIVGAQYEKKQTKFEILRCCIENITSTPSQILFVGDSEGDKTAAAKAGVRFLGVNYGYGFRNVLGYVNSPEELLSSLQTSNFKDYSRSMKSILIR